jgi:hypothetical protein
MDWICAATSFLWHLFDVLAQRAGDHMVKQPGSKFSLAQWKIHAI